MIFAWVSSIHPLPPHQGASPLLQLVCPIGVRPKQNKSAPYRPLPSRVLNTEPKASEDPEKAKLNAEAAERSLLWNLGWFADPVYFGDYVSTRLKHMGRCNTPCVKAFIKLTQLRAISRYASCVFLDLVAAATDGMFTSFGRVDTAPLPLALSVQSWVQQEAFLSVGLCSFLARSHAALTLLSVAGGDEAAMWRPSAGVHTGREVAAQGEQRLFRLEPL